MYNHTTVYTKTLADLSNGEITVNDITVMETMILKALRFELCPPMSCSFITSFHALLPLDVQNSSDGQDFVNHATFLTELSVMIISFRSLDQASLAFAAVLNTIDVLGQDFLSPREKDQFIQAIESSLHGLNRSQESIVLIRKMLTTLTRKCSHFQQQEQVVPIIENSLLSNLITDSPVDARDDINNTGIFRDLFYS